MAYALILALFLAPFAAPAGPTARGESVDDLDQRARALASALGPADDEARRRLAAELLCIDDELRARMPGMSGADLARAHLARYRILSALGQHHPGWSRERRLESLVEAREHAKRSGSREALARARLLYAALLRRYGRFLDAYEELSDTARELEDASATRPFILHALAEVERNLGRYQDALVTLDECAASRPKEAPWKPLEWRVAGARGAVFLDLGVLDLAARYIGEEGALVEPLRAGGTRFKKDLITWHLHSASLAFLQGRYANTVEMADRFLADEELYDGEDAWRAELLLLKGAALSTLARAEEDHVLAAEALREALSCPDLAGRARARGEMQLAGICLRIRDLQSAEEHLARAAADLDRFRVERSRDDVLSEDAELTMLRARLAVARGEDRDVLTRLAGDLARALEMRLDQWSRAPLRSAGLGFLQAPARRAWLTELFRLYLLIDGQDRGGERAVQELIRVQERGTLVRSAGAEGFTLDDVRRTFILDDRGILAYVIGPDRSYAFAIDDARTTGFELARGSEIEAAQRAHRAAASSSGDASAAVEIAAARALSGLLFPEPLARRVEGWAGVTIVASDELASAPFEVLPCGGMPRLGFERPVARLPTLPLGLLLAQRARPAAKRDVLLIAAPDAHPELVRRFPEVGPLPLDRAEAARLLSPYDSTAVDVLLKEEARRVDVLRVDLSRYRVVQFLAHGVLDHDRERPACIVLGGDGKDSGLLTCSDVESWSAPRFAILTCCRAGTGPSRTGDDTVGNLGGAFLARGAQAVLLTDRDLSYAQALELSRQVHRRLASGASPAAALQHARRALVESGVAPAGATAGIEILGLGHRPLFPPRPETDMDLESDPWRGRPVLFLAGLVLLSLVLALGRRRLGLR